MVKTGSFTHKKKKYSYEHNMAGSGMTIRSEGGTAFHLNLTGNRKSSGLLVSHEAGVSKTGKTIFTKSKKTADPEHLAIYKKYGPTKDANIVVERKSPEKKKAKPDPTKLSAVQRGMLSLLPVGAYPEHNVIIHNRGRWVHIKPAGRKRVPTAFVYTGTRLVAKRAPMPGELKRLKA